MAVKGARAAALEDGGHADGGIRTGAGGDRREQTAGQPIESPAQHGAGEQARGEDAAGIAGSKGKGRGQLFEKRQGQQGAKDQLAVQSGLDRGKAGTEDARQLPACAA